MFLYFIYFVSMYINAHNSTSFASVAVASEMLIFQPGDKDVMDRMREILILLSGMFLLFSIN